MNLRPHQFLAFDHLPSRSNLAPSRPWTHGRRALGGVPPRINKFKNSALRADNLSTHPGLLFKLGRAGQRRADNWVAKYVIFELSTITKNARRGVPRLIRRASSLLGYISLGLFMESGTHERKRIPVRSATMRGSIADRTQLRGTVATEGSVSYCPCTTIDVHAKRLGGIATSAVLHRV